MTNFEIETITINATTASGKELVLSSNHERAVAYYKVFEEGEGTVRVVLDAEGKAKLNEDGTVRLAFPDRFDKRITAVKVSINSVETSMKADPASDDSMFA